MNNYHLYEEIGHGKHSTIYKGRRKFTIHYVAVKSIDKTKRSRVLNEYSIGKEVLDSGSEPSLCGVYEWHETRNHLWVVGEYCAGGDLLRVLKQDACISLESQVVDFFAQIAKGLLVMHAKGVVFADMKPGNILFTESGDVKLTGFSVSQRIDDIEVALTSSGLVNHGLPRRGSPFYMAPELFDETGFHSIASDIYAFGCVLCEIVSGRTPFSHCTSFSQLCLEINTKDRVELPRQIQGKLQDLLMQMLAKDPGNRITWSGIITHPWVVTSGVPTREWMGLIRKISPVEERFLQKFFIPKSDHRPRLSRRRNSSADVITLGKEGRSPTGARQVGVRE